MNHGIYKRILALAMAACLACSGAACALTGSEALGLTSEGEVSSMGLDYETLRPGAKDTPESPAKVVILQNRLKELGYLSGNVDGHYGKKTQAAVQRFQEQNGLTPNGIADPTTQAVLHSRGVIKAGEIEMELTDVALVQQKLAQWGFLNDEPDGVNGYATQTAVAMFKHYVYVLHEIGYRKYTTPAPTAEATPAPGVQPVATDMDMAEYALIDEYGYNGEITDDLLLFITGEKQFKTFEIKLQQGDRGEDVLRMQNRLSRLGYLWKPDGSFGEMTRNALMYFQKRNGLEQSGIADRVTQELLFSEEAVESDMYITRYRIYVDISDQYVYVFGWQNGGYNEQVAKFICSTGVAESPTPIGVYQAGGKVGTDEWYHFEEYNCYARYPYRIAGGIMFHSVLYNWEKEGPSRSGTRALGERVTNGCVRLKVDDAKWIYENCPAGTTVVVRE